MIHFYNTQKFEFFPSPNVANFERRKPRQKVVSAAMSRIPVKRGEDAHSYRYMMPRPSIQCDGRVTILSNTAGVCHSIGRTAVCLAQWFKVSLSAPVVSQGNIQVRKVLSQKDVEKLIYDFIDVFVLCPTCSNPETLMFLDRGHLKLRCVACGCTAAAPARNQHAVKMEVWIAKNLGKQELQQKVLVDDKPIESLDDFVIVRSLPK